MNDLDLELRALVDAARSAEPTTLDRARVRAALAAKLGAGALPSHDGGPRGRSQPSSAPHGAPGHAPAAAASAGTKLFVAGVLIGAAGFAGGVLAGTASVVPADLARHGVEVQALRRAFLTERVTQSPSSPATEKQPYLPAPPPARVAVIAPEPSPLPPRPASPPSAPPRVDPAFDDPLARTSPRPSVSTLREETDLLRQAQTLLQAGDAAGALARLDDLGARHPDGLLREERLAARVVALCAAGREGEARREADRFLLEAPLSVHAARVRASCAFAANGDRGPGFTGGGRNAATSQAHQ